VKGPDDLLFVADVGIIESDLDSKRSTRDHRVGTGAVRNAWNFVTCLRRKSSYRRTAQQRLRFRLRAAIRQSK